MSGWRTNHRTKKSFRILYHGTSTDVAQKILESGEFRSRDPERWTLSNSLRTANTYAQQGYFDQDNHFHVGEKGKVLEFQIPDDELEQYVKVFVANDGNELASVKKPIPLKYLKSVREGEGWQ